MSEHIKALAISFCTGETPYVKLEQALNDMSIEERRDFGKWADEYTQRSAFINRYAEMRGGLGLGDHGHKEAVIKSNTRRRQVRRIIGYTYPEDPIRI